ncbi:unnamed protein product [Rotaria sordida]|uniref:Uncharacterized protein n=1 Tax=Rotaria sordida TaxID=392033 RepID=A0A819Q524_9BILA|nr:unnamed protein product [Rotaria sordida]
MLDARRRIADQKSKEVLKLNEKGNATSEENFVAAVNITRRRDPVLERRFKDCSLPPYHSNYLHRNSQNQFIELLSSAVLK